MSSNNIKILRLRPVRCNECEHLEYIKMTGSNNIASFKCNLCRLGRLDSNKKKNGMFCGRNMQVESKQRASHDRKK